MKQFTITRRGRLIAALAVASLMIAIPQASASSSSSDPSDSDVKGQELTDVDPAAAQMVNTYRISVDDAESRIKRQKDYEKLTGLLEESDPEHFAGGSVDHEDGSKLVIFNVGKVGEATLQAVRDSGISEFVKYETATYNLITLNATKSRINETIDAEVAYGYGINIDTNHVRIALNGQATQSQAEELPEIKAILAESPNMLEFERAPQNKNVACTLSLPGRCDSNVYRGGAQLLNYYSTSVAACSLGFNVQGASGTYYVMTAGHCFSKDSENEWDMPANLTSDWRITTTTSTTVSETSNPHIGNMYKRVYGVDGDFGMIKVDHTANIGGLVMVKQFSSPGKTTVKNDAWKITDPNPGLVSAMQNQYICRNGRTTGTVCGKVVDYNVTRFLGYRGIVPTAQFMDRLSRVDVDIQPNGQPYGVTCQGDSGGTVATGGTVYGLVSSIDMTYKPTTRPDPWFGASPPNDPECAGRFFYSWAKDAIPAMGPVSIVTG